MSSANASTSSLEYDPTFAIFTSFAYYPHEESSSRLDRHLRRLTQAHKVLAKLEPQCWCNLTQPLSEEHVSIAIRSALDRLKQDSRVSCIAPAPSLSLSVRRELTRTMDIVDSSEYNQGSTGSSGKLPVETHAEL
jgi:hypothetical protein